MSIGQVYNNMLKDKGVSDEKNRVVYGSSFAEIHQKLSQLELEMRNVKEQITRLNVSLAELQNLDMTAISDKFKALNKSFKEYAVSANQHVTEMDAAFIDTVKRVQEIEGRLGI